MLVKEICVFLRALDNKKNPFIYVPNVLTGFYPSSPNCIQYKSEEDIEGLIESNGTHLELIIISKHGLSGLKSITKKTYKHKDCIKKGKFNNAFSFRIINN